MSKTLLVGLKIDLFLRRTTPEQFYEIEKEISKLLYDVLQEKSSAGYMWVGAMAPSTMLCIIGFVWWCCRRSPCGGKATSWGRVCLTRPSSPPSALKAPPIRRRTTPRATKRTTAKAACARVWACVCVCVNSLTQTVVASNSVCFNHLELQAGWRLPH